MNEFFQLREYAYEPMVLESEVCTALNNIKNNKVHGSEGIPIELIKHVGDEKTKFLIALYQKNLTTGKWPKYGKNTVYIPIPKKEMLKNVQITGS